MVSRPLRRGTMNGIPHYMPCNAARIGKTDLIAHCKGWNGRHNPLVRRELEVFATKRMTLAVTGTVARAAARLRAHMGTASVKVADRSTCYSSGAPGHRRSLMRPRNGTASFHSAPFLLHGSRLRGPRLRFDASVKKCYLGLLRRASLLIEKRR